MVVYSINSLTVILGSKLLKVLRGILHAYIDPE